ncbi:MAG: nucleotide exchange factor GrpE [Bacteroidetes bacterium]|nr:nucleotide exchange factor GrpE [Bacteroidota bacterium]
MFFKKKKSMSEHTFDNDSTMNDNNDSMADGNGNEEALARELNSDESIANNSDFEAEMNAEEQLRAELDESKDKYLRLVAEFDNFRRRTAKERIEMIELAGKDVIKSLLEVLDDSDRAAKQIYTTEDVVQIREGVMLVFNKLHNTLQQRGLKKMESVGKDFDADLHEAITEIPVPDKAGKVIDEIEPGYYLNEKLIRHAKVVVGK